MFDCLRRETHVLAGTSQRPATHRHLHGSLLTLFKSSWITALEARRLQVWRVVRCDDTKLDEVVQVSWRERVPPSPHSACIAPVDGRAAAGSSRRSSDTPASVAMLPSRQQIPRTHSR
jgi:hypothetical protein